jgi:hypothetical protein
MTRDDFAVISDQDRIGEPETLDRARDLFDLSLRMAPRIARVGF